LPVRAEAYEPKQGSVPPPPPAASPRAAPAQPVASGEQSIKRRQLIGRVIGDKYGVTGLIGEGGMGAVYEAEHLAIGRLVAVKVLHPKHAQKREAISRLQHEARVAGTIGHPNICEIYDMGRLDDGSPYVVMERLHGETLAERIQRDGVVPFVEVSEVVLQVLSALSAAHEKSVIHRDLKPDNIFLVQRANMPSVAKLLDFGISKVQAADHAAMDLTRTGMVMGTPYYMAPEQARGDRTLDQRVDLWAVGVILYEALTGRRPFVARNYNALLMQILTSRHRPVTELVPSVPAAVSLLIDKALSKMREDRFQSAQEFQQALLHVRGGAQDSVGRAMYGRRATDRPIPDAPAEPKLGPMGLPNLSASTSSSGGEETPMVASRQVAEEATYVVSTGDLVSEPPSADDEAPTFVSPKVEEDNERTIVDPPSFLSDSVTKLRDGGSTPPERG
jgi:serine/threonine-protein kinase